jgi:hypothetical protein
MLTSFIIRFAHLVFVTRAVHALNIFLVLFYLIDPIDTETQ